MAQFTTSACDAVSKAVDCDGDLSSAALGAIRFGFAERLGLALGEGSVGKDSAKPEPYKRKIAFIQ